MADKLYDQVKTALTKVDQGIWRIDFNKLNDVCVAYEARLDGIERNNQIMMRAICPAGKCRLRDGK